MLENHSDDFTVTDGTLAACTIHQAAFTKAVHENVTIWNSKMRAFMLSNVLLIHSISQLKKCREKSTGIIPCFALIFRAQQFNINSGSTLLTEACDSVGCRLFLWNDFFLLLFGSHKHKMHYLFGWNVTLYWLCFYHALDGRKPFKKTLA